MKMKRLLVMLTVVSLSMALLAGCGKSGETPSAETPSGEAQTSEVQQPSGEEEGEEDDDTGDASLDNPRNQDGIGETELLVVSFGTSFNDNRRLSIGAIEEAMEKAFPDLSVRRAFTSQIIIDHVKSRDG